MLMVFSGLGAFIDKKSLNLPEFQFLQKELPRLNPEGTAEVEAAAATASTATASVLSANFVINLLFTGSMNGLWSLLNSV